MSLMNSSITTTYASICGDGGDCQYFPEYYYVENYVTCSQDCPAPVNGNGNGNGNGGSYHNSILFYIFLSSLAYRSTFHYFLWHVLIMESAI